jgi:hypothetical protein
MFGKYKRYIYIFYIHVFNTKQKVGSQTSCIAWLSKCYPQSNLMRDSSPSKVPTGDNILKVNANSNRNEIFTLKRDFAKLYF